jgi:hypothetical protein
VQRILSSPILFRSERSLSRTQALKFGFFLANSQVVASREIVIGLINNPKSYVRIVYLDTEVLASVFLILCSLYSICSVRVVGRGESQPPGTRFAREDMQRSRGTV